MNTLVVYYSQHGTTKMLAKKIQEKLNADIYEIIPDREYPHNMNAATGQAIKEMITRNYPDIKGSLPDLNQYDRIVIGGPTWGWSVANPVRSYLRKANLRGKEVSSFWTYMDNSNWYNSKMKKSVKGSEYMDGIGVIGTQMRNNPAETDQRISQWIQTIA